MRPLHLKMSISLDGFVGGPNGEIDWIFKTYDQASRDWTVATVWNASAHLMGSRTFRDMAAWWPQSTEVFAPPMNEIPKVVFSRSGLDATTTRALEDATRQGESGKAPVSETVAASWARPVICGGDLAEDIARLKCEDGKPLLAHGGARFAQSLVASGLVDEYHLMVHPVALGRGLALFARLERPLGLTLVSATSFPGGTVAKVYRPASFRPS